MSKKKLLSFFILSVFCLSLMGALTGVKGASAGIRDRVLEGESDLQDVALDTYDAEASGEPTGGRKMEDIIALAINTVLGLLGVIFLVIIIYAGFLWMTAGGNDDQVGKAKKWLVNGIIGVVIVIAAYSISYFVLSALLS